MMARSHKLKVFRTPIGFHDAYVAAPSQKAALDAWGAGSNLFASGSAERVEDPELMRDPLADPGKVIRRLRGTFAEHVAALPKDDAKNAPKRESAKPSKPGKKARVGARMSTTSLPPRPNPRPDRTPLDRAEAALAMIETQHAEAMADLARRQAELDADRRALQTRQHREKEKLQRRINAARGKYDRAIRVWRDN